jgi:hypothetical protein
LTGGDGAFVELVCELALPGFFVWTPVTSEAVRSVGSLPGDCEAHPLDRARMHAQSVAVWVIINMRLFIALFPPSLWSVSLPG